jgi:hypothetical protein
MSIQQIIEILAKAEANRKANKEEILARMDTYHEKRIAMFDAYEKRMMACLGQTEANTEKIEQDAGMMQSVEEHQNSLTEDFTVMPIREPRKQRRVRKLAVQRCQKPKERNRGFYGSWKRVTIADRTSHHATVAWRKRKLLRKDRTQDNFGSACQKKVSRHATVAWQKGNSTRKIWIQVNSESSKEFAGDGMKKGQGCKYGIKRRDVMEPP